MSEREGISDAAAVSTRVFGCRLSNGEEMGTLRGGLYAARLNLGLFLTLNPEEDPRDVVVVERTTFEDGTVHDRYIYAMDLLAGDEFDAMERAVDDFALALAGDDITASDFIL